MLRLNKNQLGQGLVELAILGSILIMVIAVLFAIGINYNRYQDLNMRTTRNARAMAYNPLFRETQREVSLTMVEDKPVMDLSSSSVAPNYTPYVASASNSWSNKLYWSYEASNENLAEIFQSMLDLPSQNFIVNGNYINLQTGNYEYNMSLFHSLGARKKKDVVPLVPDADCVARDNISASWCWEEADDEDLEEGASVDFFPFDGKEEMVLRKIDAEDVPILDYLIRLGIPADWFPSLYLILSSKNSPIDGSVNSKDYFLREETTQGIKSEFGNVTGGGANISNPLQSEELKQEESSSQGSGDTVSTWNLRTNQETIHHFNFNQYEPNPLLYFFAGNKMGLYELAVAKASTASVGTLAGLPFPLPWSSFWPSADNQTDAGEFKTRFLDAREYKWVTPKIK